MKLEFSLFKTVQGFLDSEKIFPFKQLINSGSFIETGTYLGDTTHAMRSIFNQVISIELSEELFERATDRFKDDPNVILFHGNSTECLADALDQARGTNPIIWLDAHWSGGNTARASENTPIVSELARLRNLGEENAIIIIDDIRYFIDIHPGFEIHEANSGYPKLQEIFNLVKDLEGQRYSVLNGDLLFIFPGAIASKINISDVLHATQKLRLGLASNNEIPEVEKIIGSAKDSERSAIMALPEIFQHSLQYGIGGEFLYWRGLIFEHDGDLQNARADFSLARKCGWSIRVRDWE